MTMFVVVDIGCHECGVGSVPVGVYDSEWEAEEAMNYTDAQTRGWREGGHTGAEVFEMKMGDMFSRTIDGTVVEQKEITK